jgi:hypothetical protein
MIVPQPPPAPPPPPPPPTLPPPSVSIPLLTSSLAAPSLLHPTGGLTTSKSLTSTTLIEPTVRRYEQNSSMRKYEYEEQRIEEPSTKNVATNRNDLYDNASILYEPIKAANNYDWKASKFFSLGASMKKSQKIKKIKKTNESN